MASQVPYSGVPDVAPALNPTPQRETQTPIDAFGGAVAQAMTHLGDAASQSANEIFSRAAEMQQMKDNADATAATADTSEQFARAYSQYATLQGKDAVDGLDPFLKNLDQIRQTGAGALNSPYTAQLYNEQTRFMQSRLFTSAAVHSAEQNRAYSTGAIAAKEYATGNIAMANPGDLDTVYAGLASIKKDATDEAIQEGTAGPDGTLSPLAQMKITQRSSTYMSNWLSTLAKTDPFSAQKYFQKAVQDGNLAGEDIGKVNDIVTQYTNTRGSLRISDQATSGIDLHYGTTPVTMDRAKDAIGGFESNNNYGSIGPMTSKGDHGIGRYMVMGTNLAPWLKEAGMAQMTEQQYLANPAAQDQLFNFKFGQFMQSTGSFNGAANMWFTGSAAPDPTVTDATATTAGHTPAQYLSATNARLAKTASIEDINNHSQELIKASGSMDPDLGDYVTQRNIAKYNQNKAMTADAEFQAEQTVSSAVVSAMKNGQLPTNIDQLRSDPDVANAFDHMSPDKQRDYMRALAANAEGPTRMDNNMLASYYGLKGMESSSPDEFLKQNIIAMNLPASTKKELLDDKVKIYAAQDANPQISQAMTYLAPKLAAANLTKQSDPTGYNQFLGNLGNELQQYQKDKGKRASDQDIDLIASRLLQTQSVPWQGLFGIHGTQDVQMFRMTPPKDWLDRIKANPAWVQQGRTPTDEDLQQLYVYQQYQQQFGKVNGRQ